MQVVNLATSIKFKVDFTLPEFKDLNTGEYVPEGSFMNT